MCNYILLSKDAVSQVDGVVLLLVDDFGVDLCCLDILSAYSHVESSEWRTKLASYIARNFLRKRKLMTTKKGRSLFFCLL